MDNKDSKTIHAHSEVWFHLGKSMLALCVPASCLAQQAQQAQQHTARSSGTVSVFVKLPVLMAQT